MPTIEDRLAIGDLFVRYTTALDAGDVETIVGCFAEDGALESPTVGTYSGRPAIREFAQRFARFRENGAQLRHVISNLAVEIAGERASATCYLLNLITRNGRSELLAPGRYECDLVKVGGEWLFRRRVVILDHPVTLEGI
jgi:ketosteroid isomerase-like protein